MSTLRFCLGADDKKIKPTGDLELVRVSVPIWMLTQSCSLNALSIYNSKRGIDYKVRGDLDGLGVSWIWLLPFLFLPTLFSITSALSLPKIYSCVFKYIKSQDAILWWEGPALLWCGRFSYLIMILNTLKMGKAIDFSFSSKYIKKNSFLVIVSYFHITH